MRHLILICLCGLLLYGCRGPTKDRVSKEAEKPAKPKEIENKLIELPKPRLKGEVSLEETLRARKSVRNFTEENLSLEQISQLLWATQGSGLDAITGATRTAPSAGALHPLEIYLVKKDGVYHYELDKHALRKILVGDHRSDLSAAALGQTCIEDATADVVITAIYERTAIKYGDRATRYVHIEAGHAAQNILLQTTALNLGAVPIGAFNDEEVQKVLSLPEDHKPLYIIPVGYPQE